MPTYAYQCESCGNEFDLRQSFSASTEQPCPSCAGLSRRRLSVPTVIYKGSGFYTTDYARKGMSDSSSSLFLIVVIVGCCFLGEEQHQDGGLEEQSIREVFHLL